MFNNVLIHILETYMILLFHKTEITISDRLRYCPYRVTTNSKVWLGIKLFMHVLFFYFNFFQEVICPVLFSHM